MSTALVENNLLGSNKLMVDVETLGIGVKPLILSIGLVVFNTEQQRIVAEKLIRIDPVDAQKMGLEIDFDTVLWWLKQDQAAIQENFFTGEKENLKSALITLNDIYKEFDCTAIYSNGAVSDLLWLASAFSAAGVTKAWGFREERCYRTLVADLPKVDVKMEGIKHSALDDARFQAQYLIELLKPK